MVLILVMFNIFKIFNPKYDREGYDREGYDRWGYDRDDYDRKGYDREGYDRKGYDRDGYDKKGHNIDGYSRDGYDKDGYDREGYDRKGYDRKGYSKDGFNNLGFDKNGYNIDGYSKDGFDRDGYDENGYNKEGYKKTRYKNKINNDKYKNDAYNSFNYSKIEDLLLSKNKSLYNDLKIGQILFCKYRGIVKISEIKKDYFIVSGNKKQSLSDIGSILFFDEEDIIMSPISLILKNINYAISDHYSIKREIKKLKLIINLNYDKKEDFLEKKHFEYICNFIKNPLVKAKNEYEKWMLSYNDFSEEFDLNDFTKKSKESKDLYDYYFSIRREPFFARIDFNEVEGLYIGKKEFKNLVIDWADPICSLYYDYQFYIGSKKNKIKLVRDFDILGGIYNGFCDLYSLKNPIKKGEEIETIKDNRLLMIINSNRKNKSVHDIISTIQANQYKIITTKKEAQMLILGCAGSGKTMIMFHRLKYIIRNNKDIALENIFLISSTGLLNSESNDLSIDLKIESVNKLSTIDFYKYIIKSYSKKNSSLKDLSRKKVILNNEIENDFILKQYSKSNIENMILKTKDIIFNKNNRLIFIESEEKDILNKINNITSFNYKKLEDAINENNDLYNILDLYNKAIEEIKNISIENIEQRELPEEKKNLLNEYKNLLGGKTKYNNKGKISKDIKDLRNFFDFFIKCGKLKKAKESKECKKIELPEKLLEKFNSLKLDPFNVFQECSYLFDKTKRLQEFKNPQNTNKDVYLYDITKKIINDSKYKNNINTKKFYEYELFLYLCIIESILRPLENHQAWIFIDEFQDYSLTELNLLKKIFPKGIFNYFGDFNQCISIKGIKEKKELKDVITNFSEFNISENYRNAYEITEFCNNKFNLNMMPIGIAGAVNISKLDHEIFENPKNNDRIALITKSNTKIFKRFSDKKFNYITSPEDNMVRNKINVFPVHLAKGLEFEKVFVLLDDLTRNEQYIACTRALNELVLIDSNNNLNNSRKL